MDVFNTISIPASMGPIAVAIANALGNGMEGMFITQFDDETDVENPIPIGYISTGWMDENAEILADATTIKARLAFLGSSITDREVEGFVAVRDLVRDDPDERMKKLITEAAVSGRMAPAWVSGSYAKDVYVKHRGIIWLSLVDRNTFQPGVRAWRKAWET